MENPGCCSSPVHDKKWILQHVSSGLSYNLCFACAILNLENDRQFTVHKRLILSELVDILRKVPRIIETAVENEDKVIMHASMILLGLSCGKDERLAAPARECLLLFLFHTKKEAVELAVTQRMTVEYSTTEDSCIQLPVQDQDFNYLTNMFAKSMHRTLSPDSYIQEEESYLQTLPQLRLLGGLFQLLPEIIEKTLTDNGKFLQFVVNGMTYPSEEVKSAVVYLLIQIFSADFRTSDGASSVTDRLIVSGILNILTHDEKKDLTKNTLALLKVFLSKEPRRFGMFFENSSKTSDFSVIIKKMILSPDSSLQVSIIQTLCHVLSDASEYETHVHLLLAANIPELLFEAICIKNDLLIETILCCLVLMSQYSLFFKNCHNIYGMTTILDVSHHLLSVKNWRLLCVAFNFLTRMASSDQCLSSGSIRCSLFQQSIKLVEKAFKVCSTTVLLAAGRFFTVLLKKRNLPTPFPSSSILHVVHSCLKDMSAYLSPNSHSDTYSRKYVDNIDKLPTEIKILMSGLNIIYYNLRIAEDNCTNTVTEDAFSCPGNGNIEEIQESYKKRFYIPIMNISLSALDEIFIPYSLHLDSKAHIGQIIWFHVVKVLSIAFQGSVDDELLFAFTKKILKVRLFKHLWDVKMNELYLSNCGFVDVKDVCSQCLKLVLHCFLKKSDPSDTYMEIIDNGITYLDCSFQECARFLSQKSDISANSSTESNIASAQVAFLCLCYISFSNEELLIDVKLLIPHLAYYITCNYESFSSSEIIVKHLIYIIAVCMYECVSKGIKLDTGLIEANGLLWTLMSKLSSYSLIYTHHKVLLWWCFRNESANPFCSYVLRMWLESSMETENQDVNILLRMLCLNTLARKTYMDLFDLTSPIQSRIAFLFLKEAYECEVHRNTAFSENMKELISDLVQHIHVSLTRLFIIKNYGERQSNDEILSLGQESLLWCYDLICPENLEIPIKLIFQVTSFCCSTKHEGESILVPAIRYLHFAVKKNRNDEKSWYVVAENAKLPAFLHKCFGLEESLKFEALHLLVAILERQIDENLKSSFHIKISFTQILKWLNCSCTKGLTFQLLKNLIKTEFEETFLRVTSQKPDSSSTKLGPLSSTDIRILILYLQNEITLGDPTFEEDVITTYVNLLNILSEKDWALEKHIMLEPWLRIVLESKFPTMQNNVWTLFKKWFGSQNENSALVGIVHQVTDKLINSSSEWSEVQRACALKLHSGIYKKYISKEKKTELKNILDEISRNTRHEDKDEKEKENENLVSQVERYLLDATGR